jgi:hypothetical protein
MFQLWTIFDHFGDPSGFCAAVVQLTVENFRDSAIRVFSGTAALCCTANSGL